jgi:ribonuclease D
MPETVSVGTNWTWVDQNNLDAVAGELTAIPVFALDTEFVRERTYFAIPAVVQIHTGTHNFLVDAVSVTDWSWLAEAFRSGKEVVMHAPGEDFEVLQRLCRQVPVTVFDTQRAAAFCGHGASLSLKALVMAMLGVELDKGESRSDWLQRPLSAAQLKYAAADTEHLLSLREKLLCELKERDLLSCFREDMQQMAHYSGPDPDTAYLSVRGMHQLSSESEWKRLKALARWRELEAIRKDRPKRFVVSDETLLWLASNNPRNFREMRESSHVRSRDLERFGQVWLAVLEQAEHERVEPPTRIIDVPEGNRRVKELKKIAAAVARERGVPPEVLYNNRLLQGLVMWLEGVREEPPSGWVGWRREWLEPALTTARESDLQTNGQ